MCFGKSSRKVAKMPPSFETESTASSASSEGVEAVKRVLLVNGDKEGAPTSPKQNGVAVSKKKATKDKEKEAAKALENGTEEEFKTGMQCAIRNLYSGKEDKVR